MEMTKEQLNKIAKMKIKYFSPNLLTDYPELEVLYNIKSKTIDILSTETGEVLLIIKCHINDLTNKPISTFNRGDK